MEEIDSRLRGDRNCVWKGVERAGGRAVGKMDVVEIDMADSEVDDRLTPWKAAWMIEGIGT